MIPALTGYVYVLRVLQLVQVYSENKNPVHTSLLFEACLRVWYTRIN